MFYVWEHYAGLFEEYSQIDISHWVSDFWSLQLPELQRIYSTGIPPDFVDIPFDGGLVLSDPAAMLQEAAYLVGRFPVGLLNELLGVGQTAHFKPSYLTSIHHLYQLSQWDDRKRGNVQSILEWGGGYGDMAAVARRLYPGTAYTIVDLPLMSLIQWAYLGAILGFSAVNLVQSPEAALVPGCINLIPLHCVEATPQSDLFLSTFALSESNEYTLNHVLSKNWFGAQSFFLAYEPTKELFPIIDEFMLALPAGKRVPGIPAGTEYCIL